MRVVYIFLLMFQSMAQAYQFENQGCSSKQIQFAKDSLNIVQKKWQAGEVTQTDVFAAELALMETIYCSEKPNPYSVSCLEMTDKSQQWIDFLNVDRKAGMRTMIEYGEALSKAGKLFQYCGTSSF